MKRIIKIKNTFGNDDKYILKDVYNGFGIYEEKTPSGYFKHQSWLISNNKGVELVINSFNRLCKEEVLDIIDNFNETGKFGIKALMHCGSLHMHSGGRLI